MAPMAIMALLATLAAALPETSFAFVDANKVADSFPADKFVQDYGKLSVSLSQQIKKKNLPSFMMNVKKLNAQARRKVATLHVSEVSLPALRTSPFARRGHGNSDSSPTLNKAVRQRVLAEDDAVCTWFGSEGYCALSTAFALSYSQKLGDVPAEDLTYLSNLDKCAMETEETGCQTKDMCVWDAEEGCYLGMSESLQHMKRTDPCDDSYSTV
ncbi:hypothetical protein CYMTET_8441 [Cymbomonas tetramitiformis]|uniref:Uncharacterized protein n=1 Tax=Cymbomonas tetramitiformis TaxID=36881 RepID=A0AAE0LFU3_9CHLO|nr:hypothetical protein CYMTET_8441 [Cymbomonas tetramitiformis]